MSLPPLVSVCLVTYNRSALLSKTLDSILAQSFVDFELIISDDFSTDGTEEICREYCRKDSRIIYKRNSQNLGMPGNLNISLHAGKGSYLANLHDGDVYREDLLEKWKEALDNFPQAGFVFNAYQSTDANGNHKEYHHPLPLLIPGKVLGARLLSRWDSCVFGTVMARRSVYEKIGWFDPKFGNYSDVDMWLRISRDYDVVYLNETLIDLMPSDPTRFYSFIHWKVLFWLCGIHVANLERFSENLPEFTSRLSRLYLKRRRFLFLRSFLLCLKHKRWDRARDGLYVWRDGQEDPLLRILGQVFGKNSWKPDWYEPDLYWDMVKRPRI